MQSGHGNGRSISNGYGRIGPNHHGIAKQPLIKKPDPKAILNGNVTSLNSMSRGEENRDRERQEARAQREMNTRVNLTPSPDKKEAMFAVVPRSPNNSTIDKRFSMILGDFLDFAKQKNNHSVIGVDQQPPTPAPSSQIHDPDTYCLPPLQPVPVKTSTPSSHYASSSSSSHRSHHQGAPNVPPNRPKNQMPPSQIPSNKHPSNSQFAEEMKRSHKSGPGPGPGVGPGSRGPHQERESSCKAAPLAMNGRGRPHTSNERAMKDPQILKIMSEMNDLDLKAPVSALLKTPRPDHQSSFTFPTPVSNMQGFRVPMHPSSKGKPPDRPPTKLLDPHPNDEFALSEESDEEVSPSKIRKRERVQKGELLNRRSKQNSLSVSDDLLLSEDSEFEAGNLSRSTDSINAGGCPSSSGIPLHSTLNRSTGNILSLMDDNVTSKRPISPLKTTDESSNSEDSSGSESESSSSDEEGKKSLPPSSPPPNDTNPWNLSTIFQQSVKPESPKQQEVSSRGGYNEESLQDSDQDHIGQLPDHMTEVAPPVVTTMPRMRIPKNRLDDRPKTATHSSLSTDESSEEEISRPTPKVQRTAGVKSSSIHSNYSRSKHLSVAKNSRLIDPNLSDDSDEEEISPSKRSAVISRQNSNPSVPKKLLKTPTLLSPRNELILQASKHSSPKKAPKKLEMKRKESSKIKSRVPSDSDSDSDVASTAPSKAVNGRSSSRVPNIRHERRPSQSPLIAHRSPRTFDIGRSPRPLVQDAASFQRQKPCEIARFPEKPIIKAPVAIGRMSVTPRSSDAELVAKPVKAERNRREEREKENNPKAEKRHRKNRHENEENTKPVIKIENVCDVAVDNSRLEVPQGVSPRLQTDSLNRKDQSNSNVSSNIIHYVNGVPTCNVSIPLSLIDRIPNKIHVKSEVEKKVNKDKEVLEMRTRGGKGGGKGKSVEINSNINSSPNEDENKFETIKRRAICSIYKKRPSSLEPEKIKQKVKSDSDPLVVTKSLSNQVAEDNLTCTKQEAKLEIKKDTEKAKVEPITLHPESMSLKRRDSNTSLSSTNAVTSGSSQPSRRHKKDKRRDRSNSREASLAKEREKDVNILSKRKLLSCSEFEELPQNKNSRELPIASENFQENPSPPLKKLKKSPETTQLTSPRDRRLSSPHPRSSQRNTSEERPHSSLSSDHYPHSNQSYHQSRSKSTPQSSQFTPKSSNTVSPYLDHDSEEDAPIEDISSQIHPAFSARDKSVEESQIVSSVIMSEYQSLPSSEYESRVSGGPTYRSGEGGVSPMLPHELLQASAQAEAYSHLHNSIPNSGIDYSSQMLSQVATSLVPAVNFISPFERIPPDIVKDHMFYLNKAKELKHQADRETAHRWLQAVMYLEAVLYFILTGESMESDPNNFIASVKMYTDTLKLIKHVSSPVFRKDCGSTDEITARLNCILAILSLRCQSLLSLKLYSIKKGEFKEAMRSCNEYIRITMNGGRQMPGQASSTPSTCAPSTSTGSATPSGITGSGTWGGSQRSAANNSPSSLSPTPSPAGSVGSEGSQSSSGYSTESVRQQRGGQVSQSLMVGQMTPPNFQPNPDLATIMKCFQVIQNLTQAHDMWTDADNTVNHNSDIRDFFIEVDHRMGPLTLNSSLRELVPYVNGAISALKKLPKPFTTPSL